MNKKKLTTIPIMDITEVENEEDKQAIYDYFRGTPNDKYVKFGLGEVGFADDGQIYSAYDFIHTNIPSEVKAEHKHTLAARAICRHLDITTKKGLKKFWEGLLINYWW